MTNLLAYLDPGSGSLLLQGLVGGVASAVVMTLLAVITTSRLLLAPSDERGAIPYVG